MGNFMMILPHGVDMEEGIGMENLPDLGLDWSDEQLHFAASNAVTHFFIGTIRAVPDRENSGWTVTHVSSLCGRQVSPFEYICADCEYKLCRRCIRLAREAQQKGGDK